MPHNYSGFQHESPAHPSASLAEGLQGTNDVLASQPQQSVHSAAGSPYDNTSTRGIPQRQATPGNVPTTNSHEQAARDDASVYSGYVLGSFPPPSHQTNVRHNIQSAAGWPTHNTTIVESYHGLPDDPNVYDFSAIPDATHYQDTHSEGPQMNNYGQVRRDDLPFREIPRDGIGRAARWPSDNHVPAHPHYGSADDSSAHSAPGNLPDGEMPSFTQDVYVYGRGSTMGNYAQAPREDLRLSLGDTLGLSDSISHHDAESAAGWPSSSAPFPSVFSNYSSAQPITVAGNPQNYTVPDGTQHQAACQTTDNRPVYYSVNDRRSGSRAGDRTSICEWNGNNGPCGKAVDVRRECIRAHISSDHLEPHLPGTHPVKCRWKDCRRHLRRDTIARHVAEMHFGIKRLE